MGQSYFERITVVDPTLEEFTSIALPEDMLWCVNLSLIVDNEYTVAYYPCMSRRPFFRIATEESLDEIAISDISSIELGIRGILPGTGEWVQGVRCYRLKAPAGLDKIQKTCAMLLEKYRVIDFGLEYCDVPAELCASAHLPEDKTQYD